MFSRLKIHYIFSFIFYLILIGICIHTFVTFTKEPTAYEETTVENEAIIPSFTLCPQEHHDSIVKSTFYIEIRITRNSCDAVLDTLYKKD